MERRSIRKTPAPNWARIQVAGQCSWCFAKYRSAMPISFLIKFFFESRSALLGHQAKELEDFYDDHDDTDYEFSHDHPYADELPTQVVGKNHKQNSAHMHVTGQSRYFDDIPYAVI